MVLNVQPVVLEGRVVRLEPVDMRHVESLSKNADPEIFRYFASLQPSSVSCDGMAEFVRRSRDMPNMLPFATVLRETDEAIGMTSYMDIRAEHLGLEIGFTWVARAFQGTRVNPECKLLLLRHAFDVLGCERVQLKTDARNVQSQAALRKLGATYEGTLRKHIRMPDGYMRDTVMYSVIRSEWPDVERRLSSRTGPV
jgi:RimJ/RimL family protein N-acetyltransferase